MKTVIVKVHSANNTTQEIAIATKDGQPNTIKAGKYVNYEVFDTSIDRAPNHIITKRVDNHLHVSFEREGQEVDLIIEDFYDNDDQALIGIAEDGTYYHYIPDTGQVSDYVTQLEAGNIEGQALGGEEMVAPWWVTAPAGFPWWLGLGLIPLPFIKDNKDFDPIDPVNDVEANPEVESIAEDTVLTGNVITNDSDENGATLTVQSATVDVDGTGTPVALVLGTATTLTATDGSAIGELTLNADGSYRFDPVPNFNGTVPTVNYTVTDPDGNTDETTLDINITPITDAMRDDNEAITITEDSGEQTGNVLNVTDADSDSHSVTGFTVDGTDYAVGETATTAAGSITIAADGAYTFMPAANFTGDMPQVTYAMVDNNDATDTDTSTLDIKITPVEDNDTNEPMTLAMTPVPTFEEGNTSTGDTVSTVVASGTNDPDGEAYEYSLTDTSGFYAIDTATGTVTLTEAGAAEVNAGRDLPAFSVTA
ncbi:Ig-like domain-containing protein, partial [Psychrobacter sp. 5A.1]